MHHARSLTAGVFGCFLASASPAVAQQWVPPPRADDPGANAADTAHGAWNWDLGDLVSGMAYGTELEIENACNSTRTVHIFVNDIPELQFDLSGCQNEWQVKQCAKEAPPGKSKVAVIIKSSPDFTWVIDPRAPVRAPRPFRKVSGTVVVFHPAEEDCLQARDEYSTGFTLAGHQVTWPPPPPGPEKIVGAGPCEVWWNTATKPSMLEPGQDCTAIMRPLAREFRDRILTPYIAQSPKDWAWLPQSGAISEMSCEALVEMKIHAQLIMK